MKRRAAPVVTTISSIVLLFGYLFVDGPVAAQSWREVAIMENYDSDRPVLASGSLQVQEARLEIEAELTRRAPYDSCVHFSVDGLGGWLGVSGRGNGQYRGSGEIRRGQSRRWTYDLSSVQVARRQGSRQIDFLQILKRPGLHQIKCYVGNPEWGRVTVRIRHRGGMINRQSTSSGGRLNVPLMGSWDFKIRSARASKPNLKTGERVAIAAEIECRKGVREANKVMVTCTMSNPNGLRCAIGKELTFPREGLTREVVFHFTPLEPGQYAAHIDVKGGAGNLWEFDKTSPSRQPRFTVVWGGDGFRVHPPQRRGNQVFYTFQFGPQMVNRIAESNKLAEQYARRMILHIAYRHFNFMMEEWISVAVAIPMTANHLQNAARQNPGQTLFYQIPFNQTAANVAQLAQLISSAWKAAKVARIATDLPVRVRPIALPEGPVY